MPLQLPGQGSVGGPWGGTMYPSWFTASIGPQLQARGPEAIANLFADYVASNPDVDFGWYWNSFKPGGQHQANRFGNGQPNNPYGQSAPPPGQENQQPTDTSGRHGPTGTNNHVQTSRPTTPGGPEPGHWQRLISHRNGVRNERWEWRQDAPAPGTTTPTNETPPVPTTPPAPTTDPPQPSGDTKPKPNPGGWQKPKYQTPPIYTPPAGVQQQGQSLASSGASPTNLQSQSTGQVGAAPPPQAPQPSSLVSGALSGNINQRRRPGFSTSGQGIDPNRFRNQ